MGVWLDSAGTRSCQLARTDRCGFLRPRQLSSRLMKIMNASKEPTEPQQSYFYVVWPEAEDKTPAAAAAAATSAGATSSAATTVINTIPSASSSSSSSDHPTFSYVSQALTTSDTATTTLQPRSPLTSPQKSPLVKEEMASVQVINNNTSLCATPGSDGHSSNGAQSPVQHIATAAALPCNFAAFPSVDLMRRYKTGVTPDYPPTKPRFHRSGTGSAVGEPATMKEIGNEHYNDY